MGSTATEHLAAALSATLISANVPDSNFEAANVVDALDRLADAGFAIATALNAVAEAQRSDGRLHNAEGPELGHAGG